MLSTIKDLFFSLTDILLSLWNFVISFFEDIVYVVRLCKSVVVGIPYYFAWMPSAIIGLLVTIFGIVVVYKVVGRD